jgi:Spy/CpxP family protein refolding chaperone
MKKLIIALGLVLCVVTFANAQGGGRQMGTPAERAEHSIARMEALKLTADQKTKLTEVFLAQGKSIDSLRAANSSGGFEGMREKMAPIQAESTKRIMALLNDEQKKSYEAMLAEQRARMNN